MNITVWGATPITLTSWQKLVKGFSLVWRALCGTQATIFFTCASCRAIEENRRT